MSWDVVRSNDVGCLLVWAPLIRVHAYGILVIKGGPLNLIDFIDWVGSR